MRYYYSSVDLAVRTWKGVIVSGGLPLAVAAHGDAMQQRRVLAAVRARAGAV